MISARRQAALAAAKQRGKKLGGRVKCGGGERFLLNYLAYNRRMMPSL
jgi:DNA invertase Pin-like site-specific DNA recombinase